MQNNLFNYIRKYKTKGFYYKLFIYLICLITIPTIVTAILIYSLASQNIQHEINNYQIRSLENIQKEIDDLLSTTDSIAVQYALDRNVNFFLSNSFEANMTTLKNLYDSISNCVVANKYIDSLYIYFIDQDKIICTSGVYSTKEFFDQGWISNIPKNNSIFIMPTRKKPITVVSSVETGSCITYMRRIPVINSSRCQGTIVININYEEFEKKLKEFVTKNGDKVFLADNNGNILASSIDEYINRNINDITGRNISAFSGSGYILDKVSKNGVMMSYTKPSLLGWRLIQITPVYVVTKNITLIKNFAFIIVAATIFLGFFMVILFAKRIYAPIKYLLNKTQNIIDINLLPKKQEMQKDEIDNLQDALDLISQSIQTERNENSILKNQVEQTRTIISSKYFQGLITGSHLSRSNLINNLIALDWPKENYTTIVLSIDNYENFKSSWSNADQVLWKYGLVNIVDEIINTRSIGIIFETIENQWIIILHLRAATDTSFPSEALAVASEIHNAINQYLKIFTITIGIGNFSKELFLIRSSYETALAAHKQKWVKGHNSVFQYNQHENVKQSYVACLEKEKDILDSLKQNDLDRAKKYLKAFILELVNKNNNDYTNIYQGIFSLLISITKMLQEMGYPIDKILPHSPKDKLDILSQLKEFETLNDVEKWLEHLFNTICDFLSDVRSPKNNKIMNEISAYIRNNYAEDLYLPVIAEKFNMSGSMLSKNFKQYLGKNFTEYINIIRIENAKRLLKETNLNLEEIAAKVGYANVQTYIRTFKKIEGITPGQYRNTSQDL